MLIYIGNIEWDIWGFKQQSYGDFMRPKLYIIYIYIYIFIYMNYGSDIVETYLKYGYTVPQIGRTVKWWNLHLNLFGWLLYPLVIFLYQMWLHYGCILTYLHACMHACIHTYIHTNDSMRLSIISMSIPINPSRLYVQWCINLDQPS